MRKYFILAVFLSSFSSAEEIPPISDIYLNRPLWSLGMDDAQWLLPDRDTERKSSFAFFSFSSEKTNMPDKPTVQKEDHIGRTTRSIPLYLAERIMLDTDCIAENHIFVVKGTGPVVSGKEWEPNALLGVFKSGVPDYLVYGHILQDYLDLRSTVTIKVWSTKLKKNVINISESKLFDSPTNIASKLHNRFTKSVTEKTGCIFHPSRLYPPPPDFLLSPYLDALGQLLIQTLVANEVVSYESMWGEEDILNWYLTLWQHFPNSDAPRLMYVRGVLASLEYGGVAKTKFLPGLYDYLEQKPGSSDPVLKLFPLIQAKAGAIKSCNDTKSTLMKSASGKYRDWLGSIDCTAYSKVDK